MTEIWKIVELFGGIGAVITGIITFAVWLNRLVDGQKCQLRSEMLRTYYRHAEEKVIRQYEAENFILMYKAYKSLRGNSFVDKIYEEVIKWRVIT